MIETVNPKILAMPSDDELYSAFFEAASEGAHDNIKNIVKKIGEFLGAAKGEIKKIVVFNPEKGLSVNLNMEIGNSVLKGFVDSQPLLVKPPLRILMAANNAATFDAFVAKMKTSQDNIDTCNTTLPKILILFMQKLSAKYIVNETEEHIKEMVHAIFG